MEAEAETFWEYVREIVEIDIENRAQGCSLDEVEAHRFLEKRGETLTVLALRANLRKSGALGEKERPKRVPLTHYLLYKYADHNEKINYHLLVNASQGDNREEIEKAQAMVDEMNAAFEDADAKAQVAAAALREAQAREAESVAAAQAAKAAEDEAKAREQDAVAREQEALAREADAREAEAPFKAAQEELEAALAEMKAQEDAYNNKTAQLKQQSEEGGVVSRNRAKVQLDAHLAEDPLPLRRAKLTTEAARKKAEKARAPFEAATKIAEAAREVASAAASQASQARAAAESRAAAAASAAAAAANARAQSEAAKQSADDAVEEARRQVEAALAYLEEVKATPGCAHGAIWWMEREIQERKRYLPASKGGVHH